MIKYIASKYDTTGLFPTIDIIDVESDTILISAGTMTELVSKPGWYIYEYVGYDPSINIAIEVDAGSGLNDDERYQYAVNENGDIENEIITMGDNQNNKAGYDGGKY